MRSLIDSRAFKIAGGLVSLLLLIAFMHSFLAGNTGPHWRYLIVPGMYLVGIAGPHVPYLSPIEPLVICALGCVLTNLVIATALKLIIRGDFDGGEAAIFCLALAFSVSVALFGWRAWTTLRSPSAPDTSDPS